MFTEILIFVCLVCFFKLWQTNKKPEGYPPGPNGLPVVGYLPFLGADLPMELSKLTKKYGKTFSIQLGSYRCVVLNDTDVIRQTFKTEECCGRPDFYVFSGRTEGKNGIVSNEGADLTDQRRFTLQHLRDFGFGKKILEGVIHEETDELLNRFRKEDGKKVNINMWFNMATVNILWQIVAGERYSHDDPRLIDIVKKTNHTYNFP